MSAFFDTELIRIAQENDIARFTRAVVERGQIIHEAVQSYGAYWLAATERQALAAGVPVSEMEGHPTCPCLVRGMMTATAGMYMDRVAEKLTESFVSVLVEEAKYRRKVVEDYEGIDRVIAHTDGHNTIVH